MKKKAEEGPNMLFRDRRDAGRKLAAALAAYRHEHPVVLALPRGGVPVGYEAALALDAPLDILVVRKLGAPGEPELGIGAVVDGDQPERVLDDEAVRLLHVSPQYIDREAARELEEIRRRQSVFRRGRPAVSIAGCTALVVDDGVATGGSMRAALRGARRGRPRCLVLAVPVAPPDTIASLSAEVDEVVCLHAPMLFHAVGQFYADFTQTSDEEVIRLLDAAGRRTLAASSAARSGGEGSPS